MSYGKETFQELLTRRIEDNIAHINQGADFLSGRDRDLEMTPNRIGFAHRYMLRKIKQIEEWDTYRETDSGKLNFDE